MKWSKSVLAGMLLATGTINGSAWAHAHVGVAIGIPLGAPVYYPPYYGYGYGYGWPYSYPRYSYYYPPSVTVAPAAPPTYIQQLPQQANAGQYWHHCRKPEGYYPYVPQCPGGWERVPVQPPGASR